MQAGLRTKKLTLVMTGLVWLLVCKPCWSGVVFFHVTGTKCSRKLPSATVVGDLADRDSFVQVAKRGPPRC